MKTLADLDRQDASPSPIEYLEQFPLTEKFVEADVTAALADVADTWLRDVDTDFPFLLDVRRSLLRTGSLSIPQAKGVLNCMRADILRKRQGDATKTAPVAVGRPMPDGTYTVVFEGGDRRTLRLRTQKPDARFAPGEQIVSFLSGSYNETDYTGFGFITNGNLRVWKRFSSDSTLVDAVRVLISDPLGAARAYGMESGRCCVCNRKLTVPESIEAGIGPVCAAGF